jgi:hypothetical protein
VTARGKYVRLAATAAVLIALLAGTFFGDDDAFPFGPFRMYSIANRTSGQVRTIRLEGRVAGGSRHEFDFGRFGMRRAEVEGQVDRLLAKPERMELLVEAYHNANPESPPLMKLYLVEEAHRLHRGRPAEVSQRTMLTWQRT